MGCPLCHLVARGGDISTRDQRSGRAGSWWLQRSPISDLTLPSFSWRLLPLILSLHKAPCSPWQSWGQESGKGWFGWMKT